jgi:hypothetical protein
MGIVTEVKCGVEGEGPMRLLFSENIAGFVFQGAHMATGHVHPSPQLLLGSRHHD